MATQILMEAFKILIVLLGAPLLIGWIRMLKCWSQGRTSAGVLQPFRDLLKLCYKDVLLAENASWVFRFTPYVVFGSTLLAGAIIPMVSTELPLTATADVIALVALFGIARFFTALAGMDVGTAFGGMGSSREMMVASMAEPAILMSVFTVSLICRSTSLSQIVRVMQEGNFLLRPSLAFSCLAFIFIALAETGRVPVDNPATHLELTMLHEAMILEYSGRHLALMEWAKMMKLLLIVSLGFSFSYPWGIASTMDAKSLAVALGFLAMKLMAAGIGIVLIETMMAKMRIFRVPEFLGSAFLFATLGMLSYFMLET
ncbi:MAG: NADH-quinone oxidoreductase subunit H [Nitrospinae bacterium]|nr:NADH-quinone oxidoreductase subunit H [Nitrospinota bacterium]